MPTTMAQRSHSLITKSAQEPNGMKLVSELVLDQLLTQFLPGFDHKWEALGPPFLDARLHSMRSDGVDDQRSYRDAGAWPTEPPQRIQKADPLHAGVLIWSRTSRSTKASGRAANASRASHEGQVFGFNHVTSWSSTPSALSQRERGTPLTAGVRRTLGLTNGRPGVGSTIWRPPTRSTACTPAWTRRATWAYEHRPRSATSTSPGSKAGCTFCTWARSWVKR